MRIKRTFRRIFGIGISRTGTTSLAVAMLALGVRTAHYAFEASIFDRAEAVFDSPVFVDYARLDRAFPGSKFIYTDRDPRRWLESFKSKVLDGPLRHRDLAAHPTNPHDEFTRRVYRELFGRVVDLHDRCLLDSYDRHREQVQRYFAGRDEDWLVLNLAKDDPDEAWRRLCDFVGLWMPGRLPHFANPSAQLWENIIHPCKVS